MLHYRISLRGAFPAASLLALILLLPGPHQLSGATSPLEEIDHGPAGWVPEMNVTIFSLVSDPGGMVDEAEYRLFREGIWGPWMEANISRRSGFLNLSAAVSLKEGEEVYYQFRALAGGEVLSTLPLHQTGRDSNPPLVISVSVPPGPYSGLPGVILEATFGPSGPRWEVPFNVTGSNWSVEGLAHLFSRGDGSYMVGFPPVGEGLGAGDALLRLEVADGAGNTEAVRVAISIMGGTEVRGIWPEGGVLTEALQARGFVIEAVEGLEGEGRIYLFSGPLNRTYTLEVESFEPIPGLGMALKATALAQLVEALPPGRYFWQAYVRVGGVGVFTTRADFTLLGGLEDISLGLPEWAGSSQTIPLMPPAPLSAEVLEGLPGVEVTLSTPSGEPAGERTLPLLPGAAVQMPRNPHQYPLFLEFPTGERVRLEPEESPWSAEILPGAPPDVRITSEVAGIDLTTLMLRLPGGETIDLWRDAEVTLRGEIASGEVAPTEVVCPLWSYGIDESESFTVCFKDALPASPWHNITFPEDEVPPRPEVAVNISGGHLTLSVICPGWGRIPIEAVDLFRVVEGRAVPLSGAIEVNLTGEAVTVLLNESTELLVEVVAGGDLYIWRGEVTPAPPTEPVIRWRVEGGEVHLWIENPPPDTLEVHWNIGGLRADGRAITLPLEDVGGEEVRASIVTRGGILNLTSSDRLPGGSDNSGSLPALPLALVVALSLLLLGILIYSRLRPSLPVKMELVREEAIPGSAATGRAARVKRAALKDSARERPRLPSASATSFSPSAKIKGAEGIYNCAICLSPVLPPEEPVKCACGARFHRRCALRKGVCPRCGRDIMVEEVGGQ